METPSNKTKFEPLALLLLSLATVGTAWCSFQAATWGGVSQRLTNLSATASRRAAESELKASQASMLDVMLFSQYINARANADDRLAQFYSERFRGEAKVAFQKWMATNPFENTNAPAHPFVPEFYKPHLVEEADAAEKESQDFWKQAGEAGRTSRSYVLLTVLLASALFCGGTAPKFDGQTVRRGVMALGLGLFVFAAVRLLLLPVQL